jgi:SHS2 domain-containing protein
MYLQNTPGNSKPEFCKYNPISKMERTGSYGFFEVLEHPADVGFRAWGDSLEEIFGNCAHALISVIMDPSNISSSEHWKLEAEGSDLESLLVNWLNEVLFHVDTRRLVFDRFLISFTEPFRLLCQATGEARTPARHPVRVSVKAVTYHQLRLFETEGRWIAEVFVDV